MLSHLISPFKAFGSLTPYLLQILFMKKKIYLHEKKYLFSRQKIFIFMKIIRS